MKKMKTFKIVIGLLFFASINPLLAQEKGTSEIKAGYGYATSTQLVDDISEIFGTIFTLGNITYENEKSSGALYMGYNYAVGEKFLLGGFFAFEQITTDVKSGDDLIGKNTGKFYTIAIESKYCYVSTEKVQLYSGLGLGYSFGNLQFDSSSSSESSTDDKANIFNFQITGIGFRYGSSFGAFAEAGFGYKGIINAGISYQF